MFCYVRVPSVSNPLLLGHPLFFKVNSCAVERTSGSSNALLESGVIPVEAFEMLAITQNGYHILPIKRSKLYSVQVEKLAHQRTLYAPYGALAEYGRIQIVRLSYFLI